MTAKIVAGKPSVVARILCEAPGRPVVSSRLPLRGAERRETQGLARPLERLAKPPDTLARHVLPACAAESRLSALHWRRFLIPGPRFQVLASCPFGLRHRFGSSPHRAFGIRVSRLPCPASSSQRGRRAPRSGSGTSRARGYEPRPRAPHRPKSARKRASLRPEPPRLPHLRQPPSAAPSSARLPEDAPRRAGRNGYTILFDFCQAQLGIFFQELGAMFVVMAGCRATRALSLSPFFTGRRWRPLKRKRSASRVRGIARPLTSPLPQGERASEIAARCYLRASRPCQMRVTRISPSDSTV
jgi:hypothetical protein